MPKGMMATFKTKLVNYYLDRNGVKRRVGKPREMKESQTLAFIVRYVRIKRSMEPASICSIHTEGLHQELRGFPCCHICGSHASDWIQN